MDVEWGAKREILLSFSDIAKLEKTQVLGREIEFCEVLTGHLNGILEQVVVFICI